MPAICSHCRWSERPGKVEVFNRRLKMWGWIPCPRCGGTRKHQSIPTHAEAAAAKAKAS